MTSLFKAALVPRGVFARKPRVVEFVACAVEGCDRQRDTRQWCHAHYNQWRTSGIAPTRPFTDRARFYKFVDKRDDDKCWPWTGVMKKQGYGGFWFKGKADRAHRVSCVLHKGDIPEGLVIRHTCDNKRCVNPKHLIVGTNLDNARDAVERGLYPRGESQGRAKLTLEQVIEIRTKWQDGSESQASMARRFGVSTSAVQFVAAGQNWKGMGENA